MLDPKRRKLLQQLGVGGAAIGLVPLAPAIAQSDRGEMQPDLATVTVPLGGAWEFTLDPQGIGEAQGWFRSLQAGTREWSHVQVPHTWQTVPESADYTGVAWYRTVFDAPAHWSDCVVRIEFEAVSHSATVWLNGQLAGKHLRKGYTAFSFDVSSAVRFNGTNSLIVRVDNSFDEKMLPRGRSSDWTTDGGIIRPVRLWVTPKIYVERVLIDAEPDLSSGRAKLQVRAVVRNAGRSALPLHFTCRVSEEEAGSTLLEAEGTETLEPGATRTVALPPTQAPLRLWHFDRPILHSLELQIDCAGRPLHCHIETFGVRKFEARDAAFYLNGERVRLMGVERMAGSHPEYGMAEPSSWINHDHDDLKELNCLLTRVHWQQDKRVLDYCDRHGILIQEEVPAWGGETFGGMTGEPSAEIMQNGLEQLREMIARDSNHPSIVSWGLCNEVDGHNPPARAFIRTMAEEARRLDPHRLLTYASNTLEKNPGDDAAGLLDFISWNEYYESWYGGNTDSVRKNLEEIHRAFPDKPIVISEYGYCECAEGRTGGDPRRIEILRNHNNVCREFDFVVGAIFFDYNDYRTHIGDKGTGVLKQRVHGVVDPYGNRKPSFDALRQESSPVENLQVSVEGKSLTVTVKSRSTLPSYTLEGYSVRWIVFGFDDLPMEQGRAALAKLAPGQETKVSADFKEKNPQRIRVDIQRPTGFSASTAWWRP